MGGRHKYFIVFCLEDLGRGHEGVDETGDHFSLQIITKIIIDTAINTKFVQLISAHA